LKWKIAIKTITSDRWSEFVLAEDIVKELWIDAWYLCDPYSSWQRWTNERTNWLIRWFIPKWTDLSKITQTFINKVVDILNLMPRVKHKFLTPYELFFNTRLNLIY
jgi:IS30 family transposase